MKIIQSIERFLARLPTIEPIVLAVLMIGTASTWAFVKLADEVVEGETQSFDRWMVQVLRDPANPADPIGPRWVEEMGRDATALGGVAWLSFTTLVIVIYLWLIGKARMMWLTMASIASGVILSTLLKNFYDRPRPDFVPHLSQAYSSSFPSGHSMLSAVVYLTLGSLLAAVLPSRMLKVYVIAVAMLLSFFVGASRVYLGVHYPTDVLAGWLAGLAWSLACWLVARWLQRRGQVESEQLPNI